MDALAEERGRDAGAQRPADLELLAGQRATRRTSNWSTSMLSTPITEGWSSGSE